MRSQLFSNSLMRREPSMRAPQSVPGNRKVISVVLQAPSSQRNEITCKVRHVKIFKEALFQYDCADFSSRLKTFSENGLQTKFLGSFHANYKLLRLVAGMHQSKYVVLFGAFQNRKFFGTFLQYQGFKAWFKKTRKIDILHVISFVILGPFKASFFTQRKGISKRFQSVFPAKNSTKITF